MKQSNRKHSGASDNSLTTTASANQTTLLPLLQVLNSLEVLVFLEL